jgi:hypothetical protein
MDPFDGLTGGETMMRIQTVAFDVRRARPTVLALALIAALGGCSGGGDPPRTEPPRPIGNGPTGNAPPLGNAPPPASGEPPLPTSNPETGGGHWWGLLSRGGEVVHSAMCLLVEAGELACVLFDTSDEAEGLLPEESIVGAVHGTLKVSSTSQASGSGKIYATPGNVLTDGTSVVADFTITDGSLYEQNSLLEFTFTSLGEESTFNGYYDHYYATVGGAFVWPADGVYTSFDIYGDPASLSIDTNGALFLQTASGCSGNGQMINIDPAHVRSTPGYNAYTVDVTVSDCPALNGAYEGLATLIDFAWVNGTDNLVIAVFNETTAIVGEAVK